MNNFLLLLKCDLKKLFAPKKNGKIGVLIAYAILAVCILFVSIGYTSIFGLILPNDSKHVALALILGIYTIFVLFVNKMHLSKYCSVLKTGTITEIVFIF